MFVEYYFRCFLFFLLCTEKPSLCVCMSPIAKSEQLHHKSCALDLLAGREGFWAWNLQNSIIRFVVEHRIVSSMLFTRILTTYIYCFNTSHMVNGGALV